MTTRFVFTPFAAEYPSSNYPQLTLSNRRPVLAFDTTTSETCYWTGVVPQGITGTITAALCWAAATATTGTYAPRIQVEAITSGDATDTDATTSFDTTNTVSAVTVPGTAGYITVTTWTLSTVDGWAAGDYVRFLLDRDVANDNAAGDIFVFWLEIRDGA